MRYLPSNNPTPLPQPQYPPPLSQKRATPLPPVFYFTKRTPTSPVLHKTGPLPPHCSSPKRCVSRGASDGRGRGPHPSGKEVGGWGDRMNRWGYPPLLWIRKEPPPASGNFCEPAPLPPCCTKKEGGGGRTRWQEVYPHPFKCTCQNLSVCHKLIDTDIS